MGWSDELYAALRGLYLPGKNPRPRRALSAECLAGVERGEGSLQAVVNRLWWSGCEYSDVVEMARSRRWRGLRRLAAGSKPLRWEQTLRRSWNAAGESAEAWLADPPERTAEPAVAVWWAAVEAVPWPAGRRAGCEAICRVFADKAVELGMLEFDLAVREIANRAHKAERTIRSRLADVKAAGLLETVRVGAAWSTDATRWRLTRGGRSNDSLAAHHLFRTGGAGGESADGGSARARVRAESGVPGVAENRRRTRSHSWASPLPEAAADGFSHGALNDSGRALYEVLLAGEPLTTSEAAAAAGVTVRTAQRALNRLASAWLARRTGARWQALPCRDGDWELVTWPLGVAGRSARREQLHHKQREAWQMRVAERRRRAAAIAACSDYVSHRVVPGGGRGAEAGACR